MKYTVILAIAFAGCGLAQPVLKRQNDGIDDPSNLSSGPPPPAPAISSSQGGQPFAFEGLTDGSTPTTSTTTSTEKQPFAFETGPTEVPTQSDANQGGSFWAGVTQGLSTIAGPLASLAGR